jgi:hypothetical protein
MVVDQILRVHFETFDIVIAEKGFDVTALDHFKTIDEKIIMDQ